MVEKLVPDPKKSKLSKSLDQQSEEFIQYVFIVSSSGGLLKYMVSGQLLQGKLPPVRVRVWVSVRVFPGGDCPRTKYVKVQTTCFYLK